MSRQRTRAATQTSEHWAGKVHGESLNDPIDLLDLEDLTGETEEEKDDKKETSKLPAIEKSAVEDKEESRKKIASKSERSRTVRSLVEKVLAAENGKKKGKSEKPRVKKDAKKVVKEAPIEKAQERELEKSETPEKSKSQKEKPAKSTARMEKAAILEMVSREEMILEPTSRFDKNSEDSDSELEIIAIDLVNSTPGPESRNLRKRISPSAQPKKRERKAPELAVELPRKRARKEAGVEPEKRARQVPVPEPDSGVSPEVEELEVEESEVEELEELEVEDPDVQAEAEAEDPEEEDPEVDAEDPEEEEPEVEADVEEEEDPEVEADAEDPEEEDPEVQADAADAEDSEVEESEVEESDDEELAEVEETPEVDAPNQPEAFDPGDALFVDSDEEPVMIELEVETPRDSEIPDVIEIASDTEVDDKSHPAPTSSGRSRSQIRLLSNPSYSLSDLKNPKEVNTDAVTISELIGSKDLKETYQFNFNVDLEYFLTFLHPEFALQGKKITFITGSSLLADHPLKKQLKSKFNISEVVVALPNRYASHHTKMMVNFHAHNEMEIVIMTCNLTQLDFGGLTQACWRSGKLKPGKTTALMGKRFRLDLMRYLAKYGSPTTNELVKKLEHIDFSSVSVELVASAPGVYSLEDLLNTVETYGYGKLRQVLTRNNLLIDDEKVTHNILAQVTSIAYPYSILKGKTASMFTHILCPLMFSNWKKSLDPGPSLSETHQNDFNYKPHIVFPTANDIAESNFGYLSGSAVHFNYAGSAVYLGQYDQNIKPYLCKWGTPMNITGREKVTPHVKYYACDNGDDWKTLKWAMVGSHNLSKQAWGYPLAKTNGTSFEVASYELSVLIPNQKRTLIPVYGKDTSGDEEHTPVRFPFVLPPTPYLKLDVPWSPLADLGTKKDRWGNFHHGAFSL